MRGNNEKTKPNARADTTASPPYCVFVNYLQAFKIPLEQIVFLNWVVSCSIAFGFKPFYHARQSILKETKLTRYAMETAREAFFAKGFLNFVAMGTSARGGVLSTAGAKLTYYEINFTKLRECLPSIIDKEAAPEYYAKWEKFCASCIRKERQQKQGVSEAEAAKYFAVLENTYNERIKVFNETAKAGTRRPQTSLARSPQRMERLYTLTEAQGLQGVKNAFIAFADHILKDGSGRQLKSPLDYFLKQEKGAWPIYEQWLSVYNSCYTYTK